jgi:hypothetical protein
VFETESNKIVLDSSWEQNCFELERKDKKVNQVDKYLELSKPNFSLDNYLI